MPDRDEGTPARGRLARTARLAALPAAYAGRTALGLGKRLGGRPAELVAELVADLGMLQGLSPLVKAKVPHLDVRELFTELRERFLEEVDYAREADAQTAFADAYRGDPDVLVPEVLAVEGEVLVTRWIDGTPL